MLINIDTLYLLLLIEFTFIMFVVAVVFISRNRKLKTAHQETLKELVNANDTIDDLMSQKPADGNQTKEAENNDLPGNEDITVEGSLEGKVEELQHIVNAQNDKILDLMGYKDIFESAQEKLSDIHTSYQEVQDKFGKLLETSIENDGLSTTMEAFENNNNGLKSYIETLEAEEKALSEKFRLWEGDLIKIEGVTESEKDIDESKYQELLQEKEELLLRVNEFQEKINEKSALIEEMQKQYDDLEKEYMILYRQQQKVTAP